jgi:hypothetical protein
MIMGRATVPPGQPGRNGQVRARREPRGALVNGIWADAAGNRLAVAVRPPLCSCALPDRNAGPQCRTAMPSGETIMYRDHDAEASF